MFYILPGDRLMFALCRRRLGSIYTVTASAWVRTRSIKSFRP